MPRIADQSGGVRERLDRLGELVAWPAFLSSAAVPTSGEEIRASLSDVVDAAVLRYLWFGHGNGIMLVHSATAPNAILRTLPALEPELWAPSLRAAWAASAALTAVYAPVEPAGREQVPDASAGALSAEGAFARAVEHGDEHVIKLTDTAIDVYERTGDAGALAAAYRAAELIEA